MSSSNNKISTFINSQVPEFIRTGSPLFVQFLESYYEFLEQSNNSISQGNLVDRMNLLQSLGDVDTTLDIFSSHLYNQFLALWPTNVPMNKATLVKNIKDFYRSKGSPKSYAFLFHALFGEDIELYYPKENILIPSSGTWFVERSVRVNGITINGVSEQTPSGLQYFTNTMIKGTTSGATAIVERVLISILAEVQVYEIFVSGQKGEFSPGETITSTDMFGNHLSATLVSGIITELDIENGGTSYNVGDPAIVQSNSGSGAVVYVSGVTTGNVSFVEVVQPYSGAGFLVNTQITITGGGGSGATANVTSLLGVANSQYHPNTVYLNSDIIQTYQNTTLNVANYAFPAFANANINTSMSQAWSVYSFGPCAPIGTVGLQTPGSGYITIPTADALGNTTLKRLGILGRLNLNNGGINYANGDQLIFTNPPLGFGSGASGNVVVNAAGSIVYAQFVGVPGYPVGGTGYDPVHLPVCTVNTATGSGANIVVTAIMAYGDPDTEFLVTTGSVGVITSMTIGNPGTGFVVPPTINLTSKGDGTAQVTAKIVTGTQTYPGRFLDETGFLSGYNFLQDADYYQNYSYVIRVKQSIDQYEKYVKNLVHPAGMKLWGQYQLINDYPIGNSITVPGSVIVTRSSDSVPYTSFVSGYINSSSVLSNTSNGSQGALSLWFQPTLFGNTGSFINTLMAVGNTNSPETFEVSLRGNDNNSSGVYVKIFGQDGTGNTLLDLRSNTKDVILPNSWIHLLASWNMTNQAQTSLYLTNVSSLNIVTFVANSNIAYNVSNVGIGATAGGNNQFLGNLSQFFFDTNYIDFSQLTNRNLFISDDLYPINVITLSEETTGQPPCIFLPGNSATINVNSGFGGNFNIQGTLNGNTIFAETQYPLILFRVDENNNYRVTESGDYRIVTYFDV